MPGRHGPPVRPPAHFVSRRGRVSHGDATSSAHQARRLRERAEWRGRLRHARRHFARSPATDWRPGARPPRASRPPRGHAPDASGRNVGVGASADAGISPARAAGAANARPPAHFVSRRGRVPHRDSTSSAHQARCPRERAKRRGESSGGRGHFARSRCGRGGRATREQKTPGHEGRPGVFCSHGERARQWNCGTMR